MNIRQGIEPATVALIALLPVVLLFGDGCAAVQDDGAAGISQSQAGVVATDTATGNSTLPVVFGEGSPPAQICNTSYGSCQTLANGLGTEPVTDAVVVPPVGDGPAPVFGNLVVAQGSVLRFVDMSTRAATTFGPTFGGSVADIELADDGRTLIASAQGSITLLDIATRQVTAAIQLPQGSNPTSFSESDSWDEPGINLYYCDGSSCSYLEVPPSGPAQVTRLAGLNNARNVDCGGGRCYFSLEDRVEVLEERTRSRVTSHAAPNTQRCVVSENGDCLYCTQSEGSGTTVIGWDATKDLQFGRIQLPGVNLFLHTNLTSSRILIGQSVGSATELFDCDRELRCTQTAIPRNRGVLRLPVNQ